MKFQSFIKYFDWLELHATTAPECQTNNIDDGIDSSEINLDDINGIKVSRKVFSGKQWLTIEDWLECSTPLCALEIRHEGRIERSQDNVVQAVFASSRLGGDFLSNGWSQVCKHSILILLLLSLFHSSLLSYLFSNCIYRNALNSLLYPN